jgi:hypothetical protein
VNEPALAGRERPWLGELISRRREGRNASLGAFWSRIREGRKGADLAVPDAEAQRPVSDSESDRPADE